MEEVSMATDSCDTSSTTEGMAVLLLKGWTMMSETCSRCREVPLMRSRDGVLKCCRCQLETRTKTNVVRESAVISEVPSVDTVDSGIGTRNKYHIVDEGGLESSLVKGVHNEYANQPSMSAAVTNNKVKPCSFDDRRVKQLCLLKFELSVALDRHTKMLHKVNIENAEDVDGSVDIDKSGWFVREMKVLRAVEMTLDLLERLESKL